MFSIIELNERFEELAGEEALLLLLLNASKWCFDKENIWSSISSALKIQTERKKEREREREREREVIKASTDNCKSTFIQSNMYWTNDNDIVRNNNNK